MRRRRKRCECNRVSGFAPGSVATLIRSHIRALSKGSFEDGGRKEKAKVKACVPVSHPGESADVTGLLGARPTRTNELEKLVPSHPFTSLALTPSSTILIPYVLRYLPFPLLPFSLLRLRLIPIPISVMFLETTRHILFRAK